MDNDNVLNEFNTLPPEAQEQVLDFIAFLRTRYRQTSGKKGKPKGKFAEEGFIGMWSNRNDMLDSSAWVRKIRETDWK